MGTSTIPTKSWDAILDQAAAEAGTTTERARQVYAAIAASIAKTIRRNNDYEITNWGTFRRSKRAARNGTNPRTGAHIKIKSHMIARFILTPHLKHRLKTVGFA